MSAIETHVPALAAGQLLDAIGPDRSMNLHDALAGASLEEVGIALRTVTDALVSHDRTHRQLLALRDFLQSILRTGITAGEAAVASAVPVTGEE